MSLVSVIKCCKRRTLLEKYEILHKIGEGKSGTVYYAKEREEDGRIVAIKLISIEYLTSNERQLALDREMSILKILRHPSVLDLIDIYHDSDGYAIVTNMAEGELMHVLYHHHNMQINERDVAFIISELVKAVGYLHMRHIAHRDIKLENVLLKTRNIEDGILLIDFGLAQRVKRKQKSLHGMNGTCYYMAPEMYGKDSVYDYRVDMWAIGVLTFVLLFGTFPFDGKFLSQVEDRVLSGTVEFPDEWKHHVSDQARDFICQLLCIDLEARLTAEQCLQHVWIRNWRTQPDIVYCSDKLRQFTESRTRLQPLKAYVPPLVTQDNCITSAF